MRSCLPLLVLLTLAACSSTTPITGATAEEPTYGTLPDCPAEPESDDTQRVALAAAEPDAPEIPVGDGMAIAPYPTGTVICLHANDDGRVASVTVVGQPAPERGGVLVGEGAGRRLGIVDQAAIVARVSVVREGAPAP